MLLNDLLRRIEAWNVLDPVTDGLGAVVSRLTDATPVKNLLHGSWLGHPVHPLLTDLPIGAWTWAAVLDVGGGRSAAPAADALVALGVATSVPTAMTGAADWADYNDERVRRVGLVHAVVNTTAVGLQVASLVARRRGRRGRGVALSLVGLGAVAAGGYLGGHLAYGLGSGLDRTAFEPVPDEWHDAGEWALLGDGRPHKARAGDVDVVVVAEGNDLHTLVDRCNHMGGPLSEGELVGACIRCPWHASTFRLADGEVVRGPATAPQPVLETRAVDGRVEVRAAHRP